MSKKIKREISSPLIDNETLKREFEYFKSLCEAMNEAKKPDSGPLPLRQAYISELEKVFHSSDRKHDGKVDRQEFESLIKGYFELKAIQPNKENFDTYFEKLDLDHDSVITEIEFIHFVDQVIQNDIVPFLAEEMQNRDLL